MNSYEINYRWQILALLRRPFSWRRLSLDILNEK